jgi:hypothetical protein
VKTVPFSPDGGWRKQVAAMSAEKQVEAVSSGV